VPFHFEALISLPSPETGNSHLLPTEIPAEEFSGMYFALASIYQVFPIFIPFVPASKPWLLS
jgi:hypothetical protein